MTANTVVSPAKLRNGSWGVVSTDDLQIGDIVTVRTKGGKTWTAKIVGDCAGTSNYGELYATAKCDATSSATPRSSNYDANKFNGYGAARGGYRRACKTDGNCSSFGSGRNCGGHDCDGY